MKNKLLSVTILLIVSFITLFCVFETKKTLIKNKEGNMILYLKDNGYSNIEMVDISAWANDMTFTTNKGLVVVRFGQNGLFQIVY